MATLLMSSLVASALIFNYIFNYSGEAVPDIEMRPVSILATDFDEPLDLEMKNTIKRTETDLKKIA